MLNLWRWQKNIWNYFTSWKKITSVDCLCSQLYHRALMFVSLIKKNKKKRSCNCSNVFFERTHNLDPIWHPSRHMFLSRAFRSNVNKRLWALHVVNSSHKSNRGKTKKENCHIAEFIANVLPMLLWSVEWSVALISRWKSLMLCCDGWV